MENCREWLIKYYGDLKKILQGTDTMVDIINEKYAILEAQDEEIHSLKKMMGIEYIEESRPLFQLDPVIALEQTIVTKKEKQDLSGKGVTIGWISHKARINYHDYTGCKGETRITHMYNGTSETKKEKIIYIKNNDQENQTKDRLSSMYLSLGNKGVAQESDIILVNWQKNKFYTADVIRALRFIISKANSEKKPLVIYLPFDIKNGADQKKNLVEEIISDMSLWGKIIIVSTLKAGSKSLGINLGVNRGLLFTTTGALTIGVLSLLMEWGIVRGNDPSLYGQKLRSYYLKKMASRLNKHRFCRIAYQLESIDELLKLLIPDPIIEGFRTLDLAYEFATEDTEIDAFIIYNNLNKETPIKVSQVTNIYPLVFPYFGIRGTVGVIREFLSRYAEPLITGSLAYILGNEPLGISPAKFKFASILNNETDLKGKDTIVGIIDTGIDYTHPVFIDSNGETRIISIWDQTIGNTSPYGYGTIYDSEMINVALQSKNPFEMVPHKDEWGNGTMLAGIAAGNSNGEEKTYKGVAPKASIAVVKLIPATPEMQKIYHGKYNALGFSSLDIARAFEYLATLAHEYQKPISICLPMGTNSGAHDGNGILDTIITSYAENPGVCVVLPSGEEANKGHHASGDLKEKNNQEIKLMIPQGQVGFIIEIWAAFGDRIEVSLESPKLDLEESVTILLNKAQTYRVLSDSSVWSQGSKIDSDTGCQIIRFRMQNPFKGEWLIKIKGIAIIEGLYNIWLPKTGMILPQTVLVPANPFGTIYNTSATAELITVACYDKRSLSPTASSGRGFTRDGRIKPDFMVPGVDVPGPLPDNSWGLATGTAVASAITIGVTSLVYEDELKREEQVSNTITMKAILIQDVKREVTVAYPNASRGYGLLDINTIIY